MRRASYDEGSSDKEEERDSDAAAASSYLNRPMKDLSLNENIKIYIPTRSGSGAEGGRRLRRSNSSSKGKEEGGAGIVLIPPPPSCKETTPQRDGDNEKEKCHVEGTNTLAADAEGWGDFESA